MACRSGDGSAALAPGPAAATRLSLDESARTYVQARAAAMNGDHGRAAQLLASLAGSQPDQVDIAKKALGEAIGAGRMDLALSLARTIPAAKLPTDARLLLVADEVKHRRAERALPWLAVSADNGDLTFLAPLDHRLGRRRPRQCRFGAVDHRPECRLAACSVRSGPRKRR